MNFLVSWILFEKDVGINLISLGFICVEWPHAIESDEGALRFRDYVAIANCGWTMNSKSTLN